MPKHPPSTLKKPARSARAEGHERPIMALLELAGHRWLLRILWELRSGPLKFRPLQEACGGLSPSLVSRRLSELKEARLVELGPEGYALTKLGTELLDASAPLYAWAVRWKKCLTAAETGM